MVYLKAYYGGFDFSFETKLSVFLCVWCHYLPSFFFFFFFLQDRIFTLGIETTIGRTCKIKLQG